MRAPITASLSAATAPMPDVAPVITTTLPCIGSSIVAYSPPRRGGVDAASIKRCEATEAPQTGWSDRRNVFRTEDSAQLTTPSAPSLRSAQPPLLCEEGNRSSLDQQWIHRSATLQS